MIFAEGCNVTVPLEMFITLTPFGKIACLTIQAKSLLHKANRIHWSLLESFVSH